MSAWLVALVALQGAVDQGILVIREDTAEVAREAFRLATVQDLGLAATTLNRDPATLRHVTVTGGAAGEVHLWLAPDGRLMKIEIPARRLSVERLPAA